MVVSCHAMSGGNSGLLFLLDHTGLCGTSSFVMSTGLWKHRPLALLAMALKHAMFRQTLSVTCNLLLQGTCGTFSPLKKLLTAGDSAEDSGCPLLVPPEIPVSHARQGALSPQCLSSPTLADLQNVNITLRILFRPVASQLPRIFTSIGEDYDERVLPSITTEILKSVVVSALNLRTAPRHGTGQPVGWGGSPCGWQLPGPLLPSH